MKTLKKVTLLLISIFLFTACNSDDTDNQNDFTLNLDSETNTVFAKQNASYTFSLGALEAGDQYQIKVINSSDTDFDATLAINGNEAIIGNTIIITENNLDITLTPNEVGITSFTIEVTKNGVTQTQTIALTSKIPTFNISVQQSFPSTGIIVANVTVTLLDGYDQSLTYDYNGNSTGVVAGPVGPLPVVLKNIVGSNTPPVKTITLTRFVSGYTYEITVKNEFGYTVTQSYTYP